MFFNQDKKEHMPQIDFIWTFDIYLLPLTKIYSKLAYPLKITKSKKVVLLTLAKQFWLK